MIRTLLFWEISRRLDDGLPLGGILTWIVEHDPKTEAFHRELLELSPRLRADASALLEQTNSETRRMRLRLRSPLVASTPLRSRVLWKMSTAAVLLAASLTLLGLSGLGWMNGSASGTMFVDTASRASSSPTVAVQSDAAIYDELVQLCRISPSEIGPFFTSPTN